MDRRDLFKLAGVAAAASVVTGCATGAGSTAPASFIKKASGKSVVIIGGGWGGLIPWLKNLENKTNQLT